MSVREKRIRDEIMKSESVNVSTKNIQDPKMLNISIFPTLYESEDWHGCFANKSNKRTPQCQTDGRQTRAFETFFPTLCWAVLENSKKSELKTQWARVWVAERKKNTEFDKGKK